MAATLLQLMERRDALQEARDTGTHEVEYQGRRLRYRSLAEMDMLLASLDAQIAALPGSTGQRARVHITRMIPSKGL